MIVNSRVFGFFKNLYRKKHNICEYIFLDITEFYALFGKEKINDAILYAKDLNDRYTVPWLNYDFYGGCQNVQ